MTLYTWIERQDPVKMDAYAWSNVNVMLDEGDGIEVWMV